MEKIIDACLGVSLNESNEPRKLPIITVNLVFFNGSVVIFYMLMSLSPES